jgi:hypothetical protein
MNAKTNMNDLTLCLCSSCLEMDMTQSRVLAEFLRSGPISSDRDFVGRHHLFLTLIGNEWEYLP